MSVPIEPSNIASVPTPPAVNPPPRPAARWWRRNSWWLLPELLIAALLVGSAVAGAETRRTPDQLADEVARILEQIPPAEHHDHGHEVTAQDRVLCVAEVFGTEPADASLSDVDTVYAYYMCAAGTPGTPYERSQRISGPVSVQLTNPPKVRIAQSGASYQERVRSIIPERYLDLAFGQFRDTSRPLSLRARYESEVAAG